MWAFKLYNIKRRHLLCYSGMERCAKEVHDAAGGPGSWELDRFRFCAKASIIAS